MDSLLATYASSDEEDVHQQSHQPNQSDIHPKPSSKSGGNFFSSLPPPKSQLLNPPPQTLTSSKPGKVQPESRFGSSLPPPKSSSASLFASLPQPKTETSDPFSVNPRPKNVVQFRPLVNPSLAKLDDEDDEDDEDKEQKRKKPSHTTETPSVKSFLSSIPAPRNSGSLGALPSSSGTGRRSILEGEVPALSNSNAAKETVSKASNHHVQYDNRFVGADDSSNVNSSSEHNVNHDYGYSGYGNAGADYVSSDDGNNGGYGNAGADDLSYGPAAPAVTDVYANYGGYGGYGDYGNSEQYQSKWIDRSSGAAEPEISVAALESVTRAPGKRGRTEIPQEIIEVKQDELMKNRPRADQVKLTGIAFGPAYQPASSGKGKPSKLHKRKHQIGSLYFDMRQKEMELAERRSKGFLTKAETQAKYGW